MWFASHFYFSSIRMASSYSWFSLLILLKRHHEGVGNIVIKKFNFEFVVAFIIILLVMLH